MSSDEYKLMEIYRKEGAILPPGSEIATLEIPEDMYQMALRLMDCKHLMKHFRDMIVLEHYETAGRAKEEINRRGYTITFMEKSIKFTPNIIEP